jgi:hypothetical protein
MCKGREGVRNDRHILCSDWLRGKSVVSLASLYAWCFSLYKSSVSQSLHQSPPALSPSHAPPPLRRCRCHRRCHRRRCCRASLSRTPLSLPPSFLSFVELVCLYLEMPNKKCAVCNKTAYPLESVEAGGKTWHKLCFKCSVCKITLNVTSFKAHDGGVFCGGCVPKATHTQVTDSVLTRAALSMSHNNRIQPLRLTCSLLPISAVPPPPPPPYFVIHPRVHTDPSLVCFV